MASATFENPGCPFLPEKRTRYKLRPFAGASSIHSFSGLISVCFITATTSKFRPPLLRSITAKVNAVSSGCFQFKTTRAFSIMFSERSVIKTAVSTGKWLANGDTVGASCAGRGPIRINQAQTRLRSWAQAPLWGGKQVGPVCRIQSQLPHRPR